MLEELVAKISSVSDLSEREIKERIEDKRIELSGLISDEGAAYIVAKELGIELKREEEKLNLGNIIPGMQNVDVTGKVARIYPAKEFKTERSEGKVANIVLADKTGSVRLTLWNDETEKIAGIAVGDVVNVKGFVRENMGQPEIRLGRRGSITKLESSNSYTRTDRCEIKDLSEGLHCTVRAAIVHIFDSNMFYETCPECRSRLNETEDGWECQEHGKVEPNYGIVLSGIIDDGTSSVRAVFFESPAEQLTGKSKNELRKLFEKKKKTESVLSLVPLGKDIMFEGRVKRNDLFDRIEFIVSNIANVDIKNEIEMLIG